MKIRVLLVLGFLSSTLTYGAGVSSQTVRDKRIEEYNRASLRTTEAAIVEDILPPSPRLKKIIESLRFDQGGWVTARYMTFNNSDNDKTLADALTSYGSIDTRYWMKWLYKPQPKEKNEHQLYLRLKDRYIRRTGDAPGERYDIDGPHLDQAYTILDYRPVWIEAGRRYFNVGRGIVYSGVNDGVQINFRKPGFNLGVFTAHSLPHENNIDTSVPGYDKASDRYFYGIGVGYTGIPHHSLYGFAMAQQDQSNERPLSDHDYAYHSQYLGIGSKGELSKEWKYWGELIGEAGSSRIYTSNARKDVKAWASDMELTYAPQKPLHPNLSFEYAFGSGDADRSSVTDTQLGNARGSDHNFLYFGYVPTGFALAPRLSNLHMLKAGVTISPLEHLKVFKRMTMGVDYYQFLKNRTSGGISDIDAVAKSKDIGRELDLRLDWKINPRLSAGLEWGYFFPGRAYASLANDTERFLSIHVTHMF